MILVVFAANSIQNVVKEDPTKLPVTFSVISERERTICAPQSTISLEMWGPFFYGSTDGIFYGPF